MAFVLVNSGKLLFLLYVLNNDVRLHLYTNDKFPIPEDTLDAYVECNLPDYKSIVLLGSLWDFTSNGVAIANYPKQSFTAPTNIFGCYITDTSANTLLWAERFAQEPINLPVIDIEVTIGVG